ncbi:predicted protein [Naegleria gruberi]|uniref:Predicted protein n=1 Tax=Naegleria gruberi TaxID=5762 RepID=D2W0S4_NAEGR|nr:uncharacterized protein NAEGRDRAFT_53795 [Naegleria gruberi]EFC37342.1 predicted protein [Naegleria gruberi]|eukprot:XP_002670086.1 predicted protein [Naegleria gruberi strain NEG-M]
MRIQNIQDNLIRFEGEVISGKELFNKITWNIAEQCKFTINDLQLKGVEILKASYHCRVFKCVGIQDDEEYVVKFIKKERKRCYEDDGIEEGDDFDSYDYHMGEIELGETIGNLLDSSVLTFECSVPLDDQVFILVSKYRGITLAEYRHSERKLMLCEVLQILIRLVNALKLIHDKQIIHHDIKPANIFITEIAVSDYSLPALSVVLGDFGAASIHKTNEELDEDEEFNECQRGTTGYFPPENYSCLEGDIWSLGRSFLLLLFPKNSLNSSEMESDYLDEITDTIQEMSIYENSTIRKLIEMGDLEEDLNGWKKFFLILKEMLNIDPNQRPSCSQILTTIFPHASNILQGLVSLANQFEFLDHSFSKNYNIQLLAAVSGVSYELLDKSNRDVTVQSLKYSATYDNAIGYLKNGPFNSDREIVLRAVKLNEKGILHVDESLKSDREFILQAVSQKTSSFQYLDDAWMRDREISLIAVREHGAFFKLLDESLKKDREIVLAATNRDTNAFEYIDDSFKSDREFMVNAIKKHGIALGFVSKELIDRELVLLAVQQNGYALGSVDSAFKFNEDREIVMKAVQQSGDALRYAAPLLRKDREIVKIAICQDGKAIYHVDESLRNDEEIKELAENSRRNLKVSTKFKDTNYCEKPFTLVNTPISANKKDRHIVLLAVEQNGLSLEFSDDIFKRDREIVMKAVQKNGLALEFADETLKKDREIVLTAINENEKAFEYADESLKCDRDFILQAVELCGWVFHFLDKSFITDRDIVKKALLNKDIVWMFELALPESMKNDRDIVMFAVSVNGFVLEYVNESFKKDREIVLLAVKENGNALEFADESLQTDLEIVSACRHLK